MATSSRSFDNVFLFYGADDFSIKRKLDRWKTEFVKKYPGAEVLTLDPDKLTETELPKKLEDILAPSLFSSKKLIICRNGFPSKAGQEAWAETLLKLIENLPSDYFLVFWQDKLDRRLTSVKKLLQAPIRQTQFNLPHAQQLDAWLIAETKREGANIDPKALELLAQYLGRDLFEKDQEAFDLWQAHHEVVKLASKANPIMVKDVQDLVMPKIPQNIFTLSDQVLAGQKAAAFRTLQNILDGSAADPKFEIIRLVALLAEQFRAALAVSLLSSRPQQAIAELLGWSPGRVFVNLKIAKQVKLEKLQGYLRELLDIDRKLKTSNANPRLLLEMFVQKS